MIESIKVSFSFFSQTLLHVTATNAIIPTHQYTLLVSLYYHHSWRITSWCFQTVLYRSTEPAIEGNSNPPSSFCDILRPGKQFQNLSVSSPAPVTIVLPSGETARYRTRYVWPVSVASFCIVGYFHTMIWFNEYPWVLTIPLQFLLHAKLQTCDPVSILFTIWPVNLLNVIAKVNWVQNAVG
jgi:hypothetical protein